MVSRRWRGIPTRRVGTSENPATRGPGRGRTRRSCAAESPSRPDNSLPARTAHRPRPPTPRCATRCPVCARAEPTGSVDSADRQVKNADQATGFTAGPANGNSVTGQFGDDAGDTLGSKPVAHRFVVHSAVSPDDHEGEGQQRIDAIIESNVHDIAEFHVSDEHTEHEDQIMDQGRSCSARRNTRARCRGGTVSRNRIKT